ncbi:hypothetical protein BDY17DRAFT_303893 [Neohortaea acidophila]|uniref:Inhibitor I9 domain-containing protein n=1 Tax=Neohortaea acidophila TaxID=245834 RepID=A0A6A6PIU7_9PEZI|nr:uncharacterized protein BDY17DRAFT_303893 [Neohortaea acidophila]KAF2479453.1 hypothetical protein BDY17DRAFT_303893 [Neohortaea acidophila]
MPTVNVSLKKGASEDKYEEAKKQVTEHGGKITREFSIVKGFTADIPDDKVSALESNEHITVERDGKVTTQ